MTPEQRQQIETQIKNDFAEIQKKLDDLKNEVQTETDDKKKQEKTKEIQRLEKELAEIKDLIDRITSLHEEELLALKTKLEEYKEYKQEIQNVIKTTFITYEILKDSDTYNSLVNIISSNPNEFNKLPWDTPEKKLEYIFTKIRNSIVLFLKNKLWDSSKIEYVINNTIAPAFERSLMEMLKQGHDENVSMLEWISGISWRNLDRLFNTVSDFAKEASWWYDKFNQWTNAIDYLSVHNGVLNNPEKSEVLTNPLEFKNYLNDEVFAPKNGNGERGAFSPYSKIDKNLFKVDENQKFEFWISDQQKNTILDQIWHINVKNDPQTTALIVKLLDKPEKFLNKTGKLQNAANSLLDWVNSLNSVTKRFWVDILWELTKTPEERWFLYQILDFVCKLIWITWWLEWLVKRWRLERINLTDEKNDNISRIFKQYKESVEENTSLNITDENSCKAALNEFAVTDLKNESTTKWDYLRDSMANNMDASLISPAIVKQALEQKVLLWNESDYLKEETITVNRRQKKVIVVNPIPFTPEDKMNLAHYHLGNMKSHLEKYNDNDLKDFYTNIHSTEDLALCITASLYADKDDVIEWVKAKVFLPENYWSIRLDWTVAEDGESVVNDPNTPVHQFTPWEYPFANVPPYKGIATYDLRNVKMTPILNYSELTKKHEWSVTLNWSNIKNGWYEYPANNSAWNKNNNPCDISHSGSDIWYLGFITVADWQKLAKYDSPVDGIASAMRLLKNKYKNKSITEINAWWYQWYYKPNEDIWLSALRIKWITNQCNALWVWPHQMLDFNDPTTLKSFVAQVAVLETGTNIGQKLLDDAYNLAFA